MGLRHRLRKIDSAKAKVVREIFRRYADGESPVAIAKSLNDRGVPPPGRARGWNPSTINGNPKRGSGLLNNQIYVGRLL